MKFHEVKTGIKIRGGKHDRVYTVTGYNESCLLLRLQCPINVTDSTRYMDTYLPTVFLEDYDKVPELE